MAIENLKKKMNIVMTHRFVQILLINLNTLKGIFSWWEKLNWPHSDYQYDPLTAEACKLTW